MKLKIQSIMMGCMLLLLGTVALPVSASAGDKLTTLMNKYGKFLMKKTGCTAYPDEKKSEQWMVKVTSFRYDPKEQTMIIESLHSTDPYKMSIPLSDIIFNDDGPVADAIGDCYFAPYFSKEGIAIRAKASGFDDVLFGSIGDELDMAMFYSRKDAQISQDVLVRAIKMLDQ